MTKSMPPTVPPEFRHQEEEEDYFVGLVLNLILMHDALHLVSLCTYVIRP